MSDVKCQVCGTALSPQELAAYRIRCENCWAGYNDGRAGAKRPARPGAAACYTGKPVGPLRAASNQLPRRL